MGCGCGGDSSAWDGSGFYSQASAPGQVYQYEVVFPDGTSEHYDTDTQAHAAVRVTGGGVRRVKRVT